MDAHPRKTNGELRATATQPSEGKWYLAYGSNMKSSVMAQRKIVPLDVKAVVVPTHYLTFDIFGTPYSEPSFASVEAFPNATAGNIKLHTTSLGMMVPPLHGVAYLLSSADYHRLVVTEGGGVAYDEIEIPAISLDDNAATHGARVFTAHTLKAKYPWRPNGAPSTRYMRLLKEGCEEHKLPADYQAYLDALPSYDKPNTFLSRLGALLFLVCWRPMLRCLIRLIRLKVDDDGHCPRWLGSLILSLYGAMWAHHDNVHSYIWGRGDGVKLDFRVV